MAPNSVGFLGQIVTVINRTAAYRHRLYLNQEQRVGGIHTPGNDPSLKQMVLHFCELSSHRNHILQLYRCCLRAIDRQSRSIKQSLQLKELLRRRLDSYKQLKSSWSVYERLQKFDHLARVLVQGNFSDANELLNQHNKAKKPTGVANVLAMLEEKAKPTLQSPEEVREMGLLSRYVHHRQIHGGLPRTIPREYMQKLLLPLAADWNARLRLQRIQRQMARGVPKVYLSHSSVGRSTIWFVRSPLNKGRRQSKKLSKIFISLRKEHQMVLDGYTTCKQDAQWALHEAMWEKYLETGKLTPYNFKQEMKKFKSEKMRQVRSSKEPESSPLGTSTFNKGGIKLKQGVDDYVRGWLSPIVEVMDSLEKMEDSRAAYYANYRDNVLIRGKQLDFFMDSTESMYRKRRARFKEMQSTRVGFASPYDEDNNLASILREYKF